MSKFAKMCRNGEDCANRKCSFTHTWQRVSKLEKLKSDREEKQKCRYGAKCIRENCYFTHPTERKLKPPKEKKVKKENPEKPIKS